MVIALAMAALPGCGPRGDDTHAHGQDDHDDTGDHTGGNDDTHAPHAAPDWVFVGEAEDRDPDPGVFGVALTAAPWTGPDGAQGFAYNGQVPGPTIRVPLGQQVEVTLTNNLASATTIHWHGVPGVPWEMDGSTWMIDPIAPGETFTYSFTPTAAGTFWYHPHFDTDRQVDGGLYGAFVVDDPADPRVDVDAVVLLDRWGEVDPTDPAPHDHGVAPGGEAWVVNRQHAPVLTLARGSVARLRLINASNTGYVGVPDQTVIAADQGLLPGRWRPEGGVVLGPGDRAEIEVVADTDTVVSTLPWTMFGRGIGDATDLFAVEVTGEGPLPETVAWPFDTTPPAPTDAPADLVYVLQGDVGTSAWRINGEAFPDVTVRRVDVGQDVLVEVRNLSATRHPFHMHGHAFEVVSIDGVAPAHRTIEDTLDIGVHSVARLRFRATHPGLWMVHCHILPHAHHAMMTVLEVAP